MNLKYVYIFLPLLLWGCSDSPNESQQRASLTKLDCYTALIDQIRADGEMQTRLISRRDSRQAGTFDPVWVDPAYRLIAPDELIDILDENWLSACRDKLLQDDDFRGIRFVTPDLIIVEIDMMDRYTLKEVTSNVRTLEFHRLIYAVHKPDATKYSFGAEKRIQTDSLAENLVYEVTQVKRVH